MTPNIKNVARTGIFQRDSDSKQSAKKNPKKSHECVKMNKVKALTRLIICHFWDIDE